MSDDFDEKMNALMGRMSAWKANRSAPSSPMPGGSLSGSLTAAPGASSSSWDGSGLQATGTQPVLPSTGVTVVTSGAAALPATPDFQNRSASDFQPRRSVKYPDARDAPLEPSGAGESDYRDDFNIRVGEPRKSFAARRASAGALDVLRDVLGRGDLPFATAEDGEGRQGSDKSSLSVSGLEQPDTSSLLAERRSIFPDTSSLLAERRSIFADTSSLLAERRSIVPEATSLLAERRSISPLNPRASLGDSSEVPVAMGSRSGSISAAPGSVSERLSVSIAPGSISAPAGSVSERLSISAPAGTSSAASGSLSAPPGEAQFHNQMNQLEQRMVAWKRASLAGAALVPDRARVSLSPVPSGTRQSIVSSQGGSPAGSPPPSQKSLAEPQPEALAAPATVPAPVAPKLGGKRHTIAATVANVFASARPTSPSADKRHSFAAGSAAQSMTTLVPDEVWLSKAPAHPTSYAFLSGMSSTRSAYSYAETVPAQINSQAATPTTPPQEDDVPYRPPPRVGQSFSIRSGYSSLNSSLSAPVSQKQEQEEDDDDEPTVFERRSSLRITRKSPRERKSIYKPDLVDGALDPPPRERKSIYRAELPDGLLDKVQPRKSIYRGELPQGLLDQVQPRKSIYRAEADGVLDIPRERKSIYKPPEQAALEIAVSDPLTQRVSSLEESMKNIERLLRVLVKDNSEVRDVVRPRKSRAKLLTDVESGALEGLTSSTGAEPEHEPTWLSEQSQRSKMRASFAAGGRVHAALKAPSGKRTPPAGSKAAIEAKQIEAAMMLNKAKQMEEEEDEDEDEDEDQQVRRGRFHWPLNISRAREELREEVRKELSIRWQ